ncbi:hypothetical protein [Prochlorococcus marinus]|uniref:hypothetical protein n=1 Tax=Prochlorococcus marinus TaxID=1219 RepID=UPI00031D5AFE|nr:hypothetical protein [Prochlorococcus marinus]
MDTPKRKLLLIRSEMDRHHHPGLGTWGGCLECSMGDFQSAVGSNQLRVDLQFV